MVQKVSKKATRATAELSQKGMTKRFVAYLIDWYVGAALTALPIGIVSQKLYGTMLNQNLLSFKAPYGFLAGLCGFICGLLYYLAVPLGKNKGQTFGKKLLHLKIVKEDGEDVDTKTIVLRQLVGIILIEGSLYTASVILHQLVELGLHIPAVTPLTFVGLVVSVVSALLVAFHGKHRAIHDWIAKTKVVEL